MPVFVTGGTGFVGAHVVRALLAQEATVRCLVRQESRRDNLSGLDVEVVEGDLRDRASLERAMSRCDRVFHCAADYRLYARDVGELYDSNVNGTRNVLAAAAECGAERVVYTSSVGALGLRNDGKPADEDTPVSLEKMIGHYKRSKFQAERVAEEFAAQGLGVVIVNPSTPVGDLDIKPTPTGQMIVDFLNRRMPAYVDTGLNLIDVKDVATGHLLAAERGRVGERYVLGHSNLSLREILGLLSEVTGLPAPRWRVPHVLPLSVAAVDTLLARILGRDPRVPLESVRMSRHLMYFDASKARRELGLPQSSVVSALARAASWFRDHGYVTG